MMPARAHVTLFSIVAASGTCTSAVEPVPAERAKHHASEQSASSPKNENSPDHKAPPDNDASHDSVQATGIDVTPAPVATLEAFALACNGPAVAGALGQLARNALEDLARQGAGKSARLLARWELERRFEEDGTLATGAVQAFTQTLTSELGASPPSWWIDQLASGRRPRDGEVRTGDAIAYDTGHERGRDRRGAWVAGPGQTKVRPVIAQNLTVAQGRLFFDLSMGRVELGPLPEDAVSIELARPRAGSTLYYATFRRGSGGRPFPLRAIASDGRPRWTAEVCGPNRQFLGGLGYLTVEVLVLEPRPDPATAGQKIASHAAHGTAVFTAESHGIALDVFDPSTGDRTVAWSSDLWFARP